MYTFVQPCHGLAFIASLGLIPSLCLVSSIGLSWRRCNKTGTLLKMPGLSEAKHFLAYPKALRSSGLEGKKEKKKRKKETVHFSSSHVFLPGETFISPLALSYIRKWLRGSH